MVSLRRGLGFILSAALISALSIALPSSKAAAEVSVLFTSTSSHASTTAGGDNQIGIQEPPADGFIRNRCGVSIPPSGLLSNGGSSTADLKVSATPGLSILALLQTTASALPEFGSAGSEAKLTLGFTGTTKVVVDIDIRQGGGTFLIDGVPEVIFGSGPNDFELPAGQHSFEIRVDSNDDPKVSNPNLAITLAADELTGVIPGPDVDSNPPPPSANSGVKARIATMQAIVSKLRFPNSKKSRSIHKTNLKNLSAAEAEFRSFVNTNALSIQTSGKVSVKRLAKSLRSAVSAVVKAASKSNLSAAKTQASGVLKQLSKAVP